ncbi:hypothetical protein Sango_2664700 [Sesamum angolense]|uniref:Uncharacterized protein n=1 Tax=Sesamum angolense TaxID=2727404 RepID=A0AAE1W298_9LAMI|nr:hypothetical protein Sango_2664700 [Sesamum angolense]
MPKAVYTLTKYQKRKICDQIGGLEFFDGYASNLARCIDMKELRMHGMKNHDCHIFMQKLTFIDFRGMVPEHVWSALMEVKPELNYTNNELLMLHYWGPRADLMILPCYFVNDYNFHTKRHNLGK